jgi:hypothetical protein
MPMAQLLLRLADRDAIDLDARVDRYLPELRGKPVGAAVIRDVAADLAGVRHYRSGEALELYRQHFGSARESIRAFANDSLEPLHCRLRLPLQARLEGIQGSTRESHRTTLSVNCLLWKPG